jgi:hypothetical protein
VKFLIILIIFYAFVSFPASGGDFFTIVTFFNDEVMLVIKMLLCLFSAGKNVVSQSKV